MIRLRLFISFSLVLCAAGSANLVAQPFEISVVGSYPRLSNKVLGSINTTDPRDDDTRLKGKNAYGARFTLNSSGYSGHEFSYVRTQARLQWKDLQSDGTRTQREDRINVQQFSYNFLVYFMPSRERWRPYITGGAVYHNFGAPSAELWARRESKKFGANYGGGIKLFPHKNFLVRLDFRDSFTGAPYDLSFAQGSGLSGIRSAGLFRQMEFSFGLGIAF